jgi:DNA-binding NtrC family response regulator
MKHVLIVDDDNSVRSTLSKYLLTKKYRIEEASSGKSAIKMAEEYEFDVVLLDHMMPGMKGVDVLLELKKVSPHTKVIIMTGFGTINTAIDAIRKGASEFIQKPFDFSELETLIKRCLEEKRFEKSLKKLDVDFVLTSLANPIRRKIIKLIKSIKGIHLMEITRQLNMDDHTKVVFHLRNLKDSGFIIKDTNKGYFLTAEGEKAYECALIVEKHLEK